MSRLPILCLSIPGLILAAGCAPKAPGAAPSPPPTATHWSARVADASTTPEPLTSVMKDVYDVRLLVTATDNGGGGLRLLLAAAREDGAQDLCVPTTTLDGLALGADGAFTAKGQSLVLSADDFPSRLVSADLSGRYADQTLTLDRVAGMIDTAPFVPRMGSGLADDAVCNLLPALGPCVPCEGAAGSTCWAVSVSALPMLAASTPVVLRDREMICADPNCSSSAVCK